MRLGISDFFQDIRNFFNLRRVLGIDIGTISIKMVEVSRNGTELRLENYGVVSTKGYLERANEAIQTSSLKLVESEVIPLLKTLVREVHPLAKNVIVSAPLFATFVVPIEMPILSPEETTKSIAFQARQYIPLPSGEVSYDWTKIEEFTTDQGGRFQRILITAVPNDVIRRYRNIFKAVGLHLEAVEIESNALLRALTTSADPITMIVDIGAESTSVTVAEKGLVRQVSQTDYGGMALTQALARSLDISPRRAEELKRRRGLLGFGGEYELSTSLLPFLDVIIQECNRTRRAFERTTKRTIERLILVGGGAALPGIADYMGTEMQLRIVSPNALQHFMSSNELEPAMKTLNSEFAVAAGLALRAYS